MATLAELRAKVRSQTQTTDAELTDDEVDGWLQEAFNRTIAIENEWPFFQYSWTLTLTAGESTMSIPTSPYTVDDGGIVSLYDTTEGDRVEMVDYEWAEKWYSAVPLVAGAPVHYSIWGDTISLWPAPNYGSDHTFRLRGFRRPADWIADGASAEPDCDSRLHLALANYAISLAYIQQEDETLERVYMERWKKDVEMAVGAIMDPGRQRPLVYGPRYIPPIGNSWTLS